MRKKPPLRALIAKQTFGEFGEYTSRAYSVLRIVRKHLCPQVKSTLGIFIAAEGHVIGMSALRNSSTRSKIRNEYQFFCQTGILSYRVKRLWVAVQNGEIKTPAA
ncbi:hypothetical protein COU17_00460 [Candidatus Kaiserbacteria bacterium CG10_big_fil_rev_8_21_14_0_10_49_17]|uniref:Uncharacterized protein n=1 Tax=Candidatus Kaiserbacteria bacterium CG10_big_fil_rev_8_21_14_0_10_49_17 TaxID=1974609 RepID=A0A2M6WFA5_9BACT|nr:MAG: hypothetical protein COU17_00460 [Candidatus Kaiserbacteria bacterium CG10_big_fil_rev_8_21_14_0_10_49_17]